MICKACEKGSLLWGHDAEASSHSWNGGVESDCACQPEPLCSVCDCDRIARDGFVLIERPRASRAVANGSRLLQ